MRIKRDGTGVIAGILLPMGLVCLFAFCSLALALLGGRAYRQIQAAADDSYDSAIAASYLRTKLGQSDNAGLVSLREENGMEVLVIASTIDDYETRIFMVDGTLMESYVAGDMAFVATGGMRIAHLAGCAFSLGDDGLFTAELESLNGTRARVCFALAEEGVL